MPGSPYLDETPKGILTWPRLLRIAVPSAVIVLVGAVYVDAVLEVLAVFTGVVFITAFTRR
jgi:type III secretory pathway component EscV